MNATGLRSKFSRKRIPPGAGGVSAVAGAAVLPEAELPKAVAEAGEVASAKSDDAARSEAAGPTVAGPEIAEPAVAEAAVAEAAVAEPEAPGGAEPVAVSPPDGPASESKTDAVAEPVAQPSAVPLVEGTSGEVRCVAGPGGPKGRIGRMAKAVRPAALPAAAAAALILALGIGYGIGSGTHAAAPDDERLKTAMAGIRQTGQDVARLNAELKILRGSVETMGSERERSRGEIQAKQAQLAEKVERIGQESLRAGRLAEQAEKSARTLSERLDKLERPAGSPVAAAPTPPPKPVAASVLSPDVTQTGSVGEKRVEVDPRKTRIEGIYVRDIDDGFALIEMKNGGYLDVAVGFTVPGIGRVEAIERRGRQWVVVTPKGYISER